MMAYNKNLKRNLDIISNFWDGLRTPVDSINKGDESVKMVDCPVTQPPLLM